MTATFPKLSMRSVKLSVNHLAGIAPSAITQQCFVKTLDELEKITSLEGLVAGKDRLHPRGDASAIR